MVIGNHVRVTVFGLVHFEVGVLPGELLARVNGLEELGKKMEESEKRKPANQDLNILFHVGQITALKI